MIDVITWTKALADPTRLRILHVLQGGELCVCELADALGVPQSTLSAHLQVLRHARLVQTRKAAKWTYYALTAQELPLLVALFAHFQSTLRHDPQLEQDQARLAHRLELRVDGQCVISGPITMPAATAAPLIGA